MSEVYRLVEKTIEDDKYIFYYFGQTKGLYGVGFLVKKKHKDNTIKFTGISERVCILEIKVENLYFAIIQVHAPTENSSQEEIDNFYENFAKAHDFTSSEYVFSIGDFNAQIGISRKYERSATGEYGYGIISARVTRPI